MWGHEELFKCVDKVLLFSGLTIDDTRPKFWTENKNPRWCMSAGSSVRVRQSVTVVHHHIVTCWKYLVIISSLASSFSWIFWHLVFILPRHLSNSLGWLKLEELCEIVSRYLWQHIGALLPHCRRVPGHWKVWTNFDFPWCAGALAGGGAGVKTIAASSGRAGAAPRSMSERRHVRHVQTGHVSFGTRHKHEEQGSRSLQHVNRLTNEDYGMWCDVSTSLADTSNIMFSHGYFSIYCMQYYLQIFALFSQKIIFQWGGAEQ